MALPSQLPVEIWLMVLGFVDPPLLPLLSQVCSLWRTLAFGQRTFWEDISVHSVSRRIIGWAGLRMQAARMRPVNLSISVTLFHPLSEPLRNMIEQELDHVISLTITTSIHFFPVLCDLAARPAPCLESFSLTLLDDHPRISNTLPTSLFGGMPGNLRRVELDGVSWPISGIPAFVDIETATLKYPRLHVVPFPSYLLALLPRLRRLRLIGGVFAGTRRLTEDAVRHLGSLDHLHLDLFRFTGYRPILQHVATAQIPELLLSDPDKHSLISVLSPLTGALSLDVVREISAFRIRGLLFYARSLETGQRRGIFQFLAEVPGYCALFLLRHNPDFAARVQQLCIGTEVWASVAPYISSCNATSCLIILFEGDSRDVVRLPDRVIRFPAVKRLRLKTEHSLGTVLPDDLIRFADSVSADRLHLELERVTILGGCTTLQDRFRGIATL